MSKDIIFLDCTLRDGGYYNNWDFETAKAKKLVQSLNKAGVQIVEIGYKAPVADTYFGLFRYCNEDYLDFLSKDDPADYSFMVDVKDFIANGEVSTDELDKCIKDQEQSVFSWVRLASHHNTIGQVPAMVDYFRGRGYQVGFNLMGGSLLNDSQIIDGAKIAEDAQVDVFYVADSFGSFYPNDIRRLIRLVKSHTSRILGIHTHDNQGMAYANSMMAIEEGVTFVDGTVTGMGRGAGNLLTEQFLLGYAKGDQQDTYHAAAILPIINDYVKPMKEKYKWGYSYTYMLSGLHNIHPLYCQNLIESGRFTDDEMSQILEDIPLDLRSKFNLKVLKAAVSSILETEQNQPAEANFAQFDLAQFKDREIIIIARGQEAQLHIEDVLKFKAQKNAVLIECNPTGYLNKDQQRFLVILNQLKMQEWLDKNNHNENTAIITGIPNAGYNSSKNINFYAFQINNTAQDEGRLSIPDYDVGFYAIALAIKGACKSIYLAGFDGFASTEANKTKETHHLALLAAAKNAGVEICHITPTQYAAFSTKSLYTL